MKTVPRPIFKYPGGKTKLLPQLVSRLPGKYNNYYEPFFGGGALYFHLQPKNAFLGDINKPLINSYVYVIEQVDAVIVRLRKHETLHHESIDYYYDLRDWYNKNQHLNSIDIAAALLYLNKTCFNGLWRTNRQGQFNVARGDYKNPTIVDEENLRAVSAQLKTCNIRTRTYNDTTTYVGLDDFVYMDPPYDNNFVQYTQEPFGKREQQDLANWVSQLSDAGAQVMVSNSDTLYVRDLYRQFNIETVKCARTINCHGEKRGTVDEVIIRNY